MQNLLTERPNVVFVGFWKGFNIVPVEEVYQVHNRVAVGLSNAFICAPILIRSMRQCASNSPIVNKFSCFPSDPIALIARLVHLNNE